MENHHSSNLFVGSAVSERGRPRGYTADPIYHHDAIPISTRACLLFAMTCSIAASSEQADNLSHQPAAVRSLAAAGIERHFLLPKYKLA
ncbi:MULTISPECIES: hypothetical protein [Rhizobium]|uniref:Uncharacterized protein n=1 Tax=Rhizobium tropici TaxID=398 RepID=A0A6P1C8G0_RHITR|nr:MULTISPECIES: hypothetical protein [Rhizobium]MBB4241770.1 hypothetical protein [Rhizobium tropici]MBB5593583.1 hypothetical protein [Rhizobium tropici]MBB6492095.1 hypothetical protein [Rhizobium tropici]NEV13460.1 hypothetical protein [Rhizobium tropici]TGE97594.1 hypothetical protein C9417_13870 [Rhizobium sp. SEMIA 4088]